jgi:hypothetical protein
MSLNKNILTLSYLFLRLAPFIIVSFFTLMSVFYQDFKGIIYLVGLIFSCFMSSLIYNSASTYIPGMPQDNVLCNLMSFNDDQTTASLPMGQNILGYTYAYLLYVIIYNKTVDGNVPLITLFAILIAFDGIWNFMYGCFNPLQLVLGLGLGVAFGIMWSAIIVSTKVADLQYFNQMTGGSPACSRPAKNTFKCNVYKNGQLLSNSAAATPSSAK